MRMSGFFISPCKREVAAVAAALRGNFKRVNGLYLTEYTP